MFVESTLDKGAAVLTDLCTPVIHYSDAHPSIPEQTHANGLQEAGERWRAGRHSHNVLQRPFYFWQYHVLFLAVSCSLSDQTNAINKRTKMMRGSSCLTGSQSWSGGRGDGGEQRALTSAVVLSSRKQKTKG